MVQISTQAEYLSMVLTSTQAEYLSMVPTSTQAERSLKIEPLHRLNEVSKNGGASPPRTAFVHVPNFDQNRNFFNPGLYTGGVFMLSSNLYTG
ncbi:hypothetical protein TNCV_4095481 [Trichonephila clavipes]|uniref:Uncharacterized protein n=1 Tax=Trichonephila clavipes TaxID=2585209 RepID=A0A8X6SA92_TRICX|nr:hypothetical protein TNCV_4095481 [Trichonephila clavipes]